MTERRIAIVRDYAGLLGALRARADELGVTREALDAVTGLQGGYAGKLLAPVPIKHLGHTSLGPMLAAMGLMLIVVEDVETLTRITKRMEKRQRPVADASESMLPKRKRNRRGFRGSDASRVLNARRSLVLPEVKRRRIAKGAALARWRRKKDQ